LTIGVVRPLAREVDEGPLTRPMALPHGQADCVDELAVEKGELGVAERVVGTGGAILARAAAQASY